LHQANEFDQGQSTNKLLMMPLGGFTLRTHEGCCCMIRVPAPASATTVAHLTPMAGEDAERQTVVCLNYNPNGVMRTAGDSVYEVKVPLSWLVVVASRSSAMQHDRTQQ
jgi:hypothetical protein